MEARAVFEGTWRITEMEAWARDALDLLGPATIEFDAESLGVLRFIAIVADLDCRFSTRDGRPYAEFSWAGGSEGDPISGRGWAIADGDRLHGHIFIHMSDDSAFTALRRGSSRAR